MIPDANHTRRAAMADLDMLMSTCYRCALADSRSRTVPGEGPVPCRIMLVGEGPGRREDETGKPFVGRAGQILNDLLRKIGLSRDEVFITSVVKCRPPGNRAPKHEEIAACRPHLSRQIAILSPHIIVPMGRIATRALFEMYGLSLLPLKEVRGMAFRVRDGHGNNEILLIPVYHPAVVTHNPNRKEALEADFAELGKHLDIKKSG